MTSKAGHARAVRKMEKYPDIPKWVNAGCARLPCIKKQQSDDHWEDMKACLVIMGIICLMFVADTWSRWNF